jgi:predicted DNA-binding transcriptional regulator YafY
MPGAQLARQWKILQILESRKNGLSAVEVAHELDIPLRTVYRDLESIQEAGFPLYTEKVDKNSHWILMDGFKSGFPLPLTATELMSLHISRDILNIFDGTAFQESIESLFKKVKASLPSETIKYLESVSSTLKIGFGQTKDFRAIKETISTLSDATARRRRIQMRYEAMSTGHETQRIVDPVPSLGYERVFLSHRILSHQTRRSHFCHGSYQGFQRSR